MYWYLKNVHKETISRNNLDEISSLFRISRNKNSYFATTIITDIKEEQFSWIIEKQENWLAVNRLIFFLFKLL
jgi:hypothetical protein